jgi:hypothetical protein
VVTFAEATAARDALVTFGVHVELQPSGRDFHFGTAHLEHFAGTEADKYTPALEAMSGIVTDGAPWFDGGVTEVSFAVKNAPVVEDNLAPVEITEQLGAGEVWEGSACTVYMFVAVGGGGSEEWLARTVFVGVISKVDNTESVLEFRAVRPEATLQIPIEDINGNSMQYNSTTPYPEGTFPEGHQGAVAPLVYGRCGMQARDSAHDSSSDPWGDNRGIVLAPSLGIKVPMVPVPTLADLHSHKNGGSSFSEGQFLLVSLGGTDTGIGTGSVRLPWWWEDPNAASGYKRGLNPGTSSTSMHFPHHQSPTPLSTRWSSGNENFKLVPLFSWNQQLGVALPYAKDMTGGQHSGTYFSPEALEASVMDYTQQKGVGNHTANTGRGTRHYIWSLQRIDPDFTAYGVGPWGNWTGLVQSVFLQGDRLVSNDDTTEGFSFVTTSGVVDPLACIDGSPHTYTQVPNGEILGIQLVPEGPRLGEPMCARVGMVTGGTTTAMDIQFRYTPQHLLVPNAAPPGGSRPIWNITAATATTMTHHPTLAQYEPYPVFNFWGRNEDPGLTAVGWRTSADSRRPRWEFWESDLLPVPSNFAPEVRITTQNNTAHIYAMWVEIIYRPKDIEATDTQRPIWAERQEPIPGGAYWGSYPGVPPWFGFSNLQQRKQPTKRPTLYATGIWGVDDTLTYQLGGSTNKIIEDPVSISLHVLDHYLNERTGIAVQGPGVFGSFWDAKLALDAIHSDWRMTVIQPERIPVDAFLREIGRQGMCFYHRTNNWTTGALEWRMFVDETTPSATRQWRSGTDTIGKNDIMRGTLRVTPTPLSDVRNRFTCRYGYHQPTGTFYDELVCSAEGKTLTGGDANDYWDACVDSVARYGVDRDDVIELPWIWQRSIAEEVFRWYIDQRRDIRVGVQLTASHKLMDVELGQFLKLDDDVADVVGKYTGHHQGPGSDWSDVWLNVVSKTTRYEGGQCLVDLVLVEIWKRPPIWIP